MGMEEFERKKAGKFDYGDAVSLNGRERGRLNCRKKCADLWHNMKTVTIK